MSLFCKGCTSQIENNLWGNENFGEYGHILCCFPGYTYFTLFFNFYLLILERERNGERERERKKEKQKHLPIAFLTCAFIGWFLYVLWRDHPTTSLYWDKNLTNWAIQPGPGCTYFEIKYHKYYYYVNFALTITIKN